MSGHSKWATIKRQKGANDAKRGQLFTKLGNNIAIAAKKGGNPDLNPGLALAIEKAKSSNMPTANIERSIKRGTGELGGEQVQELLFEGYGPGGAGIIVEAVTDNRNRTTSDVRAAFSKNGGNMAESGAVLFQFTRKGVIEVQASGEDALLTILDAGAQDAVEEGDMIIAYSEAGQLGAVRDALMSAGLMLGEAELQYVPNSAVALGETEAQKVMKILDALDSLDDVSNTYANFEVA